MTDLAPSDMPPAHRRNAVWRTLQVILQNVFVVWVGLRLRGQEHLPRGPALLLINHQSFLDPLLVGAPLRRPICYLARDTLFKAPVIGWILRKTYVMPIRRESAGTESLRVSLKRLEEGYLVGIFPEGTRTRDGHIGVLKPGFVALVRRANVPVIPVVVAGAFESLPRGAFFLRPKTVRVIIGQPLTADELAACSGRGTEGALVELVKQKLDALLVEANEWRRSKPFVPVARTGHLNSA